MHFNKTHIRLFNTFKDDATYMIDFIAPWFSKFIAPVERLVYGAELLPAEFT